MIMILAVLILLSSCTMEDVEYAGKVLEDVQSNGIGAISNITLPTVVITTPAPPSVEPDTTVPSTKKPPRVTTEVATTPQTTPVQIVNNDNFNPTVDYPKDGVIRTAEQLHAVLIDGASDANYAVTAAELDMEGLGWYGMEGFSGTFDFGNCVIKNASYPLFRSVKGATVKNLVIADSTYTRTDYEARIDDNPKTGESFNPYYSPVICYADGVIVSNVIIESSVSVKTDLWFNNTYHGGVVACAEGNVLISDCHFKGEFTSDSLLARFGGVAGHVQGIDENSINREDLSKSTTLIVNCSNSGTIINLAYGNDSKTGGVIGSVSNAAILGCANYGDILNNDNGQSAGVVGYVGNAAYVKNCVNTAKVTGNQFVGGICAYSNGDDRCFENCINIGVVKSSTRFVGGILGSVRRTEKLINCFNLASACDNFAYQYTYSASIDPSDAQTHFEITITNCANLENINAILERINASAPGVFVKAANGLIILA